MLLEDGAKRILHFLTLGVGKPNFLTVIHLRIESNNRIILAVQFLTDGIDRTLDDVFVLYFAGSNDKSESTGAKTRRNKVGSFNGLHCARVPDTEATGICFA